MSLAPTIYAYNDPGAPQLTGQAGSLISVLRAIIVTGYGNAPNAKAGLGWTEEFTATNKAVFRNNPVTGTGGYVRVLDNASTDSGGDAYTAAMRAYSAMTDIDTGDDPAPTPAQRAKGALWLKSTSLDATNRPWWAIGNERTLYFFNVPYDGSIATSNPQFVGDLETFKPGDLHHFALSTASFQNYFGNVSENSTRMFYPPTTWSSGGGDNSSTALALLRGSSGAVGAKLCSQASVADASSWGYGGVDGAPYPLPVNDGLLLDRAIVLEGAYQPRGRLPGLYVPIHTQPFPDLTVVSDLSGMPAGLQLLAKRYRGYWPYNDTYRGQVMFDLGEW